MLQRLSTITQMCLKSMTWWYHWCFSLVKLAISPSFKFSLSGTCHDGRESLIFAELFSPVIWDRYLRFKQVVDLGSSWTILASILTSMLFNGQFHIFLIFFKLDSVKSVMLSLKLPNTLIIFLTQKLTKSYSTFQMMKII